jgi:hypothetical protein
MNLAESIRRPHYASMTAAEALRGALRQVSGCHLSQKMDGVWSVKNLFGSIYTGEAMKDGRFFAFDILTAQGQDVRWLPWVERRAALVAQRIVLVQVNFKPKTLCQVRF